MPKIIAIDGVDFEVSDQAAQAVRKLQQRLSDAEEEATKAKEELEKKEDEEAEEEKKAEDEMEEVKKDHKIQIDTLQAKLDTAISSQPTPAQLDALVENRIKTRDAALKINPSFEFVGKDCEKIRREIVADACPDIDVSKVSADYIRARFDGLVTNPSLTSSTRAIDKALTTQTTRATADDTGKTVTDARAAFAARSRDAWKGGAK